jgi:hypothetical protein
MLKRLAIIAVLQIVLGFALTVIAFAQLAPSASEIGFSANAAENIRHRGLSGGARWIRTLGTD